MATLQEMLSLNGGDWKKAEAMALDYIAKGTPEVWLDLALLFGAQGNIKGMRQAQAEYERINPHDPKGIHGREYQNHADGDWSALGRHIAAGRAIGTLGAPEFSRMKGPLWNGADPLQDKTILLYGEGGLGDNIIGLRSASKLKAMGAKVIVSTHPSLVRLFKESPGVDGVVTDQGAGEVFYDYWIPMMSSFNIPGVDWNNIWPGPYIFPKVNQSWNRLIPDGPKLKIGIRFSGNPQFEHEQLRTFDPNMLLKAVNHPGVEVYSLQRERPDINLPGWVTDLEPFLGSWEQTRFAISRLDLVISSCTSVAHLAGAMEKPCWVLVPAMAYWTWARPGKKSAWYPSATLFRQTRVDEWDGVFKAISEDLQTKLGG